MADDPTDQQLREMAEHRGLKLVKSRRRKPGAGDFGKYGLADAAGKPLLGIGDEGLTASVQDIQDYLRADATGTWKQSADATPDPAPSRPRPAAADEAGDEPGVRRKRPPPSPPVGAPRKTPRPRDPEPERAVREKPPRPKAPEPEPEPPEPEPELAIRPARPADAACLASLLNQLRGVALDRAGVLRHLEAAKAAKAGMLVAERGVLIGCCGWAVVPTVHRGALGRITVLLVDGDHRRSTVGTALLDAAEAILAGEGCTTIEAMSDIEIVNAHNFFRTLKFDQTSYRFVRRVGPAAAGPGRKKRGA